jgi:hypothetical protein
LSRQRRHNVFAKIDKEANKDAFESNNIGDLWLEESIVKNQESSIKFKFKEI